MRFKGILTGALLFFMASCEGHPSATASFHIEPIRIQRFDQALFKALESADGGLELRQQYPAMLQLLGMGVLNRRSIDDESFFERIRSYYAEPTLHKLYADALHQYVDVTELEQRLTKAFAFLKEQLPDLQVPVICMHVSGLSQNVLVSDSLLSLSIDKYLGVDYPLYDNYFPPVQRVRMTPQQVSTDYLLGWLMASYPFAGNESVLLERMIYEGKLRYIVSQALGGKEGVDTLAYPEVVEQWCEQHEADMWQQIIERKLLYTPDQPTTDRFFDDVVSPLSGTEAPQNVGCWIGCRIVSQYMALTRVTMAHLLAEKEAQHILSEAKYRP